MDEKSGIYVTLGEIMLRLGSPLHERLFQSSILTTHFGGGEANVAISLSKFGESTKFVTVLPNNIIGDQAIQYMRSFGVDTSSIIRKGDRIGIYFLETGSGPRSSKVIYDRAYSAINTATLDEFNWDLIFNNAKWFHLTGITPALSESCAEIALSAVKEAKTRNLTISCDLNYRSKLWRYGKKPSEIMSKIVPYVDILIANEEDIQNCLDIRLDHSFMMEKIEREDYKYLIKELLKSYSQISHVAITLRESYSADHNDWSAILYSKEDNTFYNSKKYSLKNIVDRVGGGDSFAAGLIYGLNHYFNLEDALNFAVAASALKHTIPGDINLVSVQEVEALMHGEGHGRVQR